MPCCQFSSSSILLRNVKVIELYFHQSGSSAVAIFFGSLAGVSAAHPGAVVKWEEQTIRECVTADFNHDQSDQLLAFPLRPL